MYRLFVSTSLCAAFCLGAASQAQDPIIQLPTAGARAEEGATDLGEVSEMVSFMSPADFGSTVEDMRNEFVGIGIQFYPYHEEYVTIARVLYGSPAADAGVRAGDRIVAIDGRPMRYASPEEVVRRMAGEVGQPLTMTVRRPFGIRFNEPEIEVALERAVVHLPSLEEARMLPGRVAYIRVISLLYHAPTEVAGRVREYLDAGAVGVVLDLRWVHGGFVRAARDTANIILPPHTLMGSVRKHDRDGIAVHTDDAPLVPEHIPVAVLCNASTAGAAELLAAAAAASPRALLIGQKTSGRADVDRSSSLLGLDEADLLREYLHTPDGTRIHGNGITPELDTQMTANEENTLRMQMFESYMGDPELENEQNHGLVTGNDPSEVAIEDRPLATAVEWILGQQ